MGTDLIIAVVAITMALIFYTIGVWWEHRNKELRRIHLVFFIMGLVCDVTGTTVMSMMASDSKETGTLMSAHGVTGVIAIVLMLLHAVWAAIVFIRNKPGEKQSFHRFSVLVWAVWLVPYILGMFMGMRN